MTSTANGRASPAPTEPAPALAGDPGLVQDRLPATPAPAPAPAEAPKRAAGDGNLKRSCKTIRQALLLYSLARILSLKREDSAAGAAPRLSGVKKGADRAPVRVWQSFTNAIADEPRKEGIVWPVTVTAEVVHMLAEALAPIVKLACSLRRGGGRPDTLIAQLAGSKEPAGAAVAFMASCAERLRDALAVEFFARESDFTTPLIARVESLAKAEGPGRVEPGSLEIARLFLGFLRAVSWHAGGLAYETEHLTLNRANLFAIIRNLVPGAAPSALLGILRAAAPSQSARASASPDSKAPDGKAPASKAKKRPVVGAEPPASGPATPLRSEAKGSPASPAPTRAEPGGAVPAASPAGVPAPGSSALKPPPAGALAGSPARPPSADSRTGTPAQRAPAAALARSVAPSAHPAPGAPTANSVTAPVPPRFGETGAGSLAPELGDEGEEEGLDYFSLADELEE